MKSAPERGARASRPDGKFARLRDARRVWAIAAVHGEARRLASVHDLISERFQEGDRVVYLGNYRRAWRRSARHDRRAARFPPPGSWTAARFCLRCRLSSRRARRDVAESCCSCNLRPIPARCCNGWSGPAWRRPSRPMAAICGRVWRRAATARARSPGGPAPLRTAMNAAPGHTALFSQLRHAAFTGEGGLSVCPCRARPVAPACRAGRRLLVGA